MKSNYKKDKEWSDYKIQPIAIKKIYNILWPNSEIIELDKFPIGTLGQTLDIAGADKLIRFSDGTVSFLAQRFRRAKYQKYDDFTLRNYRIGGNKTEYAKIIKAFENRTMVAGFYAYGLVNESENGFIRFRVLDFHSFLADYLADKIPPPNYQNNPDGKTSFMYWPFAELKKYLIYQTDNEKVSISQNNSTEQRDYIILKLAQCHLEPGWSVTRQAELFNRYGIFTAESWDSLTDEQLKTMAVEISG